MKKEQKPASFQKNNKPGFKIVGGLDF